MTPTLRTPCAIAVASLLMATPGAYAEESSPPVAGPSASAESAVSLAGRPAGEGRPRPGRPQEAGALSPDDGSTAADGDPDADPEAEWDTGWEATRDADGDPETDADADTAPPERPGGSTEPPVPPSADHPRTPPSEAATPSRRGESESGDGHDGRHENDGREESDESEDGDAQATRGTDGTDGTDEETDRGTDGHTPADESLEEFAHPQDSEAPRRRPPSAARESTARAVTGPTVRPVPVLTLGAGITLVGVGLGFLGLRLRRR
ncbi:hypothetical protein ACFYYH_24500 [Streptomyces sp. NPDC002018]|uniref:hypothetical protein n=1 Tax=Streptomyces sp. NPDC002018 TaxID=3364629 RepID=UPI0036BFA090